MKKVIFLFCILIILSACKGYDLTEREKSTDTEPIAFIEENISQEELGEEENVSKEETELNEHEEETENIPTCGNEQELFVLAPLDPKYIKDITPLGNLAPSAHTFPTIHMYWNLKNSDEQEERSIAISSPFYAPSDMYITRMSRVKDIGDNGGLPDYGINFYPCKEVYAYFDHLATVSEEIEAAFEAASEDFCEEYTLYYESGPRDWSYCRKEVELFIEEGEYIGTVGGGKDQKALDVGIYDYRITAHTLANADRWEFYADGNLPYVTCPLDYFPDDIREAYESLIPKTAEPLCGEVVQDLPGTAQGNWFPEGTSSHFGTENEFLALVHDNYNPDQPVFSIGTSVGTIEYGEYIFTTKDSALINRDFSDLTPTKVYCYESLEPSGSGNSFDGTILVQMPDEETLLIEGQNKKSCDSSWKFSGKETRFER